MSSARRGAFELIEHLAPQTAAPKTHDIQADQRVAFRGQRVWRVSRNRRAAANHYALPDAAELMNHRASAQESTLANLNVPGEQYGVRNHDAVAYATVMRAVAGPTKTIGPYFRGCPGFGGAADRHVFANDRTCADSHCGRRSPRRSSDPVDHRRRRQKDALARSPSSQYRLISACARISHQRRAARRLVSRQSGESAYYVFSPSGKNPRTGPPA